MLVFHEVWLEAFMKRLLATAALALITGTAGAHAHLESAIPVDGTTVTAAPAAITLTFSEAAKITSFTIHKDGEAPAKVTPLPQEAAKRLIVAVPALTPGHYTVDYRVVSDDSHVVSGKLTFTVAAPQ